MKGEGRRGRGASRVSEEPRVSRSAPTPESTDPLLLSRTAGFWTARFLSLCGPRTPHFPASVNPLTMKNTDAPAVVRAKSDIGFK